MRFAYTLSAAVLLACRAALAAGEADPAFDEAQFNPQQLQDLAKGNEESRKAIEQLKALSGNDPKKQAELERVASETFAKMYKENNGNLGAMTDALEKNLESPQGTQQMLSPEQLAKLKELSRQVESNYRLPASSPANTPQK